MTNKKLKTTFSMTSLAILFATISIATTMTLVQADLAGDNVIISITPDATPSNVLVGVGAGLEYAGDLVGVDALVTYADTTDDDIITDTSELAIDNAGVNVPSGGTFTFTGSGNSATVTFTDGAGSGTVDGTIDHIDELSVTDPGTVIVTEGQESLAGVNSGLTVDIDPAGDEVWIELLDGPGTVNDIVITIDDMDWNTPGALGDVSCGTSTGTTTSALFDENTLEFTLSSHDGLDTVIEVHCEFEAFHGDVEKNLDAPCEVQIMDTETTECSFTITYSGVSANVIDTVPAEWEVTEVVNNGDECSIVTKGNSGKAATGIECNDATNVDTTVTIETRPSPGGGHKDADRNRIDVYKPTFCGDFSVNDGAQAILIDENGEPVLSTLDGEPIILDSTGVELASSVDTGDGLFNCDGELKG